MPEPIRPLISRDRPSTHPRFVYQSSVLFFNLVLVLFIASLITFGGLFFYKSSLGATRQKWADDIKKEETKFNAKGGVGNLVDLSNALNAARQLIGSHVFSSNVFEFLQKVTHPRVRFSNFSFSREEKKINLTGEGASYRTVAEQISVLESNIQVEKVDFGGLSLGEKGLVNFKVTIFFKPSLLELRVARAEGVSTTTGGGSSNRTRQ